MPSTFSPSEISELRKGRIAEIGTWAAQEGQQQGLSRYYFYKAMHEIAGRGLKVNQDAIRRWLKEDNAYRDVFLPPRSGTGNIIIKSQWLAIINRAVRRFPRGAQNVTTDTSQAAPTEGAPQGAPSIFTLNNREFLTIISKLGNTAIYPLSGYLLDESRAAYNAIFARIFTAYDAENGPHYIKALRELFLFDCLAHLQCWKKIKQQHRDFFIRVVTLTKDNSMEDITIHDIETFSNLLASQRLHRPPINKAKMVNTLCEAGELRTAMQRVTHATSAPITDEVLEVLTQLKFPSRSTTSTQSSDNDDILDEPFSADIRQMVADESDTIFTTARVRKLLAANKKYVNPGIGGIRNSHMRAYISPTGRESQTFLNNYTKFLKMINCGAIPLEILTLHYHLGLITLYKDKQVEIRRPPNQENSDDTPDLILTEDIRPIQMLGTHIKNSESLAHQDFTSPYGLLQTGVKTRNGCELNIHRLRVLSESSNITWATLDQKNAYGLINRTTALREAALIHPEAEHHYKQLQGVTPVAVFHRQQDVQFLPQERGIPQGAPSSSLIYTAPGYSILQELNGIAQGAQGTINEGGVTAYMDDTQVYATSYRRVTAACAQSDEAMKRIDGEVQLQKTQIHLQRLYTIEAVEEARAFIQRTMHWNDSDVPTLLQIHPDDPGGCPHDEAGGRILGAWIGPAAAQTKFLRRQLASYSAELNRLVQLPDITIQNFLLLIKNCILPKPTFIARTHEPRVTRPLLAEFYSNVLTAVQDKLSIQFNCKDVAQLQLAIHEGGMGYTNYDDMSLCAWLGSSLYFCKRIQEESTILSLDAYKRQYIFPYLEEYITFTADDCPAHYPRTPDGLFDFFLRLELKQLEKLQHSLLLPMKKRRLALFKQDHISLLSNMAKNHFQSLCSSPVTPGGYLWLTAFPVGRNKLPNTTFRAMWRKRLHHPQPGIQQQSRCKCNVRHSNPRNAATPTVDLHGVHLLTCNRLEGGEREGMHRAVLHSLANIAKTAGFFTIVEPRGTYIAENTTTTANGDVNARRFLDMFVANNSVNGKDSLYDVTITASLRDDMKHGHHVSEACHYLEQARRNKIAKHRTAVERDNRNFYPLVFDTNGHWSQEVDDFLTMCSVSTAERTQVPASRLKYHFATTLACTLESQVVNTILNRADQVYLHACPRIVRHTLWMESSGDRA